MRPRLLALVTAVVLLAALNLMAARGLERTVTTTTTNGQGPRTPGDLVQQGRNLFDAKGCASCHGENPIGPSLTNLKDRAAKTRQGSGAEQYVRESIVAPSAFKASGGRGGGPSGEMPALPVSAAELDALVAYVLTL